MLTIEIKDSRIFDERTEEFRTIKGTTLQLEHSLLSISKWESVWHKSFLNTKNKTEIEIIDYIRCMTLTQNVNPEVYAILSQENVNAVIQYISDPMTATTFSGGQDEKSKRFITNELIYYWMIELGIPFECQKWHINRLMTLIRVCKAERSKINGKPMSMKEAVARQRAINAQNRARFNSKG